MAWDTEKFDRMYRAVENECSYFCRHIGYLEALIEDEVEYPRVVDGSHTGRVLLLANTEIINSLVHFACRSWDNSTDAHSFARMAKIMPTEKDLEAFHEERCLELGIQYSYVETIVALGEAARLRRSLAKDQRLKKLQRLRNEVLAHNLQPSGVANRPLYNDLIFICRQSIVLIERISFFYQKLRDPYTQQIDQSRISTLKYLSWLPSLREKEAEEIEV